MLVLDLLEKQVDEVLTGVHTLHFSAPILERLVDNPYKAYYNFSKQKCKCGL